MTAIPRQVLLRYRHAAEAIADALCWTLAVAVSATIRLDFDFELLTSGGRALLLLAALAVAMQLVTGGALGLYGSRWRYGSFDEVAGLVRAGAAATVLLMTLSLGLPDGWRAPRTVPLGAGAIALVLMAGVRYAWRLSWERTRRPSADSAQRLVVFGAGEGGAQVLTAMLRDPGSPYFPVALLDDDPRKRKLRIMGIPVVGTREDLVAVARAEEATAVLVAVPSADRALLAQIFDQAATADIEVKVLPPVKELFGSIGVGDIRDLDPVDLLGRHEITTDLGSIAGYITGKRVLVTGAGGSIGSELCRQLSRFAPEELIMLDRDESALHAVQLSLQGRALLDTPDLVLGDIRDGTRVDNIFRSRRPQVVFHAAALKHLSMLERHPGEALQTNVWGSLNVLLAAAEHGVERFVNISTDKAADPSSVLGYSKRIAECLTAYVAPRGSGTFLSVRFGNVLGSRGSVLGIFQSQIESGGPITVTDPDVTRYFMTIAEACELVIQAGAVGNDGEALVLDMGEPVRIDDVARRMAAMSHRPVRIEYTGLRPGEKLDEVLFGRGEPDIRPVHPLISHVSVPPLEPPWVLAIDPLEEVSKLTERLASLSAGRRVKAPAGLRSENSTAEL